MTKKDENNQEREGLETAVMVLSMLLQRVASYTTQKEGLNHRHSR